MKFQGLLIFSLLISLCTPPASAAADTDPGWPKLVQDQGVTVTLYQPQIDSWEGNSFEARAAVSLVQSEGAEPVFGAVWLSGHFSSDKEARRISFFDIKVPSVRFSEGEKAQQKELTRVLELKLEGRVYEMDLDVLLPTLESAQGKGSADVKIGHAVPKIIVRRQPAVLVLIDGEAKLEKIENSTLERVVNTPYVLLKDGGNYFLASDTQWFSAGKLEGPWQPVGSLPKAIAEVDAQIRKAREKEEQQSEEEAQLSDTRLPQIVVSTEPAELVFIDGPNKLEPLEGNDILEVSNTDSDLIFDIDSQNFYLLLSGRWFRSKDIDHGPWEWVANDKVPQPFSEISAESELAYLRSSVAGTEESRDAVLEQSIPQTATVKRGAAEEFKVEYDGQARFDVVEGTSMKYAINTSSAVFLADGDYYLCYQGIWYLSSVQTGPWDVCDEVPDVIYSIPPSNPHYNVTYVKVYQSTPDVVYVGYTPGYTGSYVSHSCVVYGTGYYYNPWYTPYHYYPRPVTWGFHVRWNPWYGWGFGLSYSTGPFHFTFGFSPWGHSGGGWWGPARYRPYPVPYGMGYRAGYRAGYYHGRYASGRLVHYGQRNTININNTNIYNRSVNRNKVVSTRNQTAAKRPVAAQNRANNIYTDPKGHVYRRDSNGSWDRRDAGRWSPAGGAPSARPSTPLTRPTTPSTRPSTPSTRPTTPSTRPSTPSTRPAKPSTPSSISTLNRDFNARQRGTSRSTTRGSRPSSSRSSAPVRKPPAGRRR